MSILAFLSSRMGGPQEPVDVEADAIIRAFFKRNPDAAYHVTKLAMALAARPEPMDVPPPPPRQRNWLSFLLGRRHSFAS